MIFNMYFINFTIN